ncbi:hypothetical protein ACIBMX_45595 [Streptomyces phaeochromogenes]|uniref:Uncharacterized protein n=1 Tax=Streptomyces phaeochromogenes TaxID=1923 RepID=A0ABZ1HER6_STRPH|nr:hypothetical protein [Streptomyces phaeochromogenes]WSD16700.1 hypothetical protein OHB35_27555 [Streptomyces phaeochromogenes]
MLRNVVMAQTPTVALAVAADPAAGPAPLPEGGLRPPGAGGDLVLANSGIVVRLVPNAASEGRAALVLLANDEPMALTPARAGSGRVLAGALHGRRGERPWSLAWGRLSAGELSVCAEFVGEAQGGHPRTVLATRLGSDFWLAETAGDYRGVTVTTADSRLYSELWPVPRAPRVV